MLEFPVLTAAVCAVPGSGNSQPLPLLPGRVRWLWLPGALVRAAAWDGMRVAPMPGAP